VKLTIAFQAKDVEGSTSPQIGDKARWFYLLEERLKVVLIIFARGWFKFC
jgi:hypothetical protein